MAEIKETSYFVYKDAPTGRCYLCYNIYHEIVFTTKPYEAYRFSNDEEARLRLINSDCKVGVADTVYKLND